MNIIFLDTEFTNLSNMQKAALVSICLVSKMDGREFYVEPTDTWNKRMCSKFVKQTVLPMLQNGDRPVCTNCQMSSIVLAAKLKDWIETFAGKVEIQSDNPEYDWIFIERIFAVSGWPSNLKRQCGFIDLNSPHKRNALDIFWSDHRANMHHALVDARSMRFASNYNKGSLSKTDRTHH